MATTTSITTSYAGEKAQGFIAALLSAPTLDKGGITVKPNIKFKQVMQKLAVSDIVADASCDFTATSSVTLTERYLEVKDFQVNLELCKKILNQIGFQLSKDSLLLTNYQKARAYLIGHVAGKVAANVENNIWNGTGAGKFDGLVNLMDADADVNDVAFTGATTASNIISRLGEVVDAIPETIYGNEGLAIYISQADARAYVRAQAALGYKDLYHVGQTAMDFEGVKLFVANGLNGGQMVAGMKDNLFFGCGLQNDQNLVKLIDLADIDGSQNVRVVMRYSAAVQYAIGSEIVLAQVS